MGYDGMIEIPTPLVKQNLVVSAAPKNEPCNARIQISWMPI